MTKFNINLTPFVIKPSCISKEGSVDYHGMVEF